MRDARVVSAVRQAIDRALRAIDEDAPDYGQALHELTTPDRLACLHSDPELARGLFGELRKLRPVPLWVRDRAERALASKRDLSLDGAVCTHADERTAPAAQGRECWLEVPAAQATQTLAWLPVGWGLVVGGELTQVSFASLRRRAPLRALGVTLREHGGDLSAVDARLDLVIAPVESHVGPAEEPETYVRGARRLWSVESPEPPHLASAGTRGLGLVCRADDACLYALRLASVRLATVPPR